MDVNSWTDTDSKVLQILANTLANQNREQEAADLLEYVNSRDPDNTAVIKALCGVYLLLDRNQDVLSYISQHEKLSPTEGNSEEMLMIKAQALWKMGLSKEAVAVKDEYLARKTSQ